MPEKIPGVAAPSYSQYIFRKWLVLLGLLLILCAAAVFSISVGSSGLSVLQVLAALAGRGVGQTGTIVWNIRMPGWSPEW